MANILNTSTESLELPLGFNFDFADDLFNDQSPPLSKLYHQLLSMK